MMFSLTPTNAFLLLKLRNINTETMRMILKSSSSLTSANLHNNHKARRVALQAIPLENRKLKKNMMDNDGFGDPAALRL